MTTTLLFLAAILVGQTAVAAAAAIRPNIIVVLADDMGFSGLAGVPHPEQFRRLGRGPLAGQARRGWRAHCS